MIEVTTYEFIKRLLKEYPNVSYYKEIRTYFNDFPIKNGKRKINSSHDAIIVDKQGNRFPYMKSRHQRNNEKLNNFDYITVTRGKSINEILKETNVEVTIENVNISEGGGWYSKGKKYIYKDIYCEL